MITLITGVPGSGKTLFALNFVKARAEKEGREVYYSGIKDLTLPWTEFEDPTTWMSLPAGSIIVIDECQRAFRPRANGATVPPFIAEFETHRHKGIDIVLITQHPMLVDQNVRRLVGQHFNVKRIFGLAKATIREWTSVALDCDKRDGDSTRIDFIYPKQAYTWYKSAEVHTHKARIPFKFWSIFLILGGIIALLWYGLSWGEKKYAKPAVDPNKPAQVQALSGPSGSRRPMTVDEYMEARRPRIQGLPHTAAMYDEVTRPTRAPRPAACVQSATKCQCYTQQGTKIATPDGLCRDIVENGYFQSWDDGAPLQGGPVQANGPIAPAPTVNG